MHKRENFQTTTNTINQCRTLPDIKLYDRLYGSFFPTSNDDYLTDFLIPSSVYLITGLALDKIGSNTTHNTGTVLSVSTAVPILQPDKVTYFTFYDQVQISNVQWQGDSGGPVYHVFNMATSQIRPNILIGIATFGDTSFPYYGHVSKRGILGSNYKLSPTLPVSHTMLIASIKRCLMGLEALLIHTV